MSETPETPEAPGLEETRRRPVGWRLIVVLFLLLPALYIAALWVFFHTPIGPSLVSRKPEKFQISWQGGSMWRLGTIQLHGVQMGGHTPRGTWRADMKRATLEVDLHSLRQRIFRVTEAQATDCAVSWMTHRRPGKGPPDRAPRGGGAEGDSEEKTSNPPIASSQAPVNPPKRESKWRLEFQDIDILDLREIRVDQNRLQPTGPSGSGQLALNIVPRGPIHIPELRLSLPEGRVELEGEDQGAVHDFYVEARLDPMVPRENRHGAWLRFLTLELRLKAEAWGLDEGLDATSLLLRNLPVSVGGVGRLDAQIRLEKGHLRPGSRLRLDGDDILLDYLDYRGSGAGRLTMEVDSSAHLRLELSDFSIGVLDQGGLDQGGLDQSRGYIQGQGLSLKASSPSLDLMNPSATASATVTLPKSRIPAFAVYDRYLPKESPLRLTDGRGEVEARFDFQIQDGKDPNLDGEIRLVGREVEATYAEGRLLGDVELRTELSGTLQQSLADSLLSLHNTSLVLDNFRQKDVNPGQPWWARVEIPEGRTSLGKTLELSAQITAAVADSRPLVAIAMRRKPMPKWMANLLTFHPLSVGSNLMIDSDHIYLRDLWVRGGEHLGAEAELKLARKAYQGAVLLQWRRLSLGAELGPAENQRDIQLIGAKRFYRERRDFWRAQFDRQLGLPASTAP